MQICRAHCSYAREKDEGTQTPTENSLTGEFLVATDLHAHIKSACYQVHRQKVNIIY